MQFLHQSKKPIPHVTVYPLLHYLINYLLPKQTGNANPAGNPQI